MVQQIATEQQGVTHLLSALTSETNTRTAKRMLYALSCFLRSNLPAIQQFHDQNGLTTLSWVIEKHEDSKFKAIQLVLDIFNPDMIEKGVKMEEGNLKKWCQIIQDYMLTLQDREEQKMVKKGLKILQKYKSCVIKEEL
jgi:hypothetical protein